MMLDVAIRESFEQLTLETAFAADAGLVALLGPSGSGKTTTLNVIAGLHRPAHARVVVGGDVLADTERGVWTLPHKRGIGYVFQDARLFPHLSVKQNLAFGRWFNRARPEGALPDDHVIELLELGPLLHRTTAHLSGGERRRIALARALFAHPRLLLLDEPLGSLDHAKRQEILPYLDKLLTEIKLPMVYVTHERSEIEGRAVKIVSLG